jgi:hypothetical protein
MMMGIKADIAAIGSHFFNEESFNLICCFNIVLIILLNDYLSAAV